MYSVPGMGFIGGKEWTLVLSELTVYLAESEVPWDLSVLGNSAPLTLNLGSSGVPVLVSPWPNCYLKKNGKGQIETERQAASEEQSRLRRHSSFSALAFFYHFSLPSVPSMENKGELRVDPLN